MTSMSCRDWSGCTTSMYRINMLWRRAVWCFQLSAESELLLPCRGPGGACLSQHAGVGCLCTAADFSCCSTSVIDTVVRRGEHMDSEQNVTNY